MSLVLEMSVHDLMRRPSRATQESSSVCLSSSQPNVRTQLISPGMQPQDTHIPQHRTGNASAKKMVFGKSSQVTLTFIHSRETNSSTGFTVSILKSRNTDTARLLPLCLTRNSAQEMLKLPFSSKTHFSGLITQSLEREGRKELNELLFFSG